MTEFQPIQFARLPARRRALQFAELFSPGFDEPNPPARKAGQNVRTLQAEVQARRKTAM